jgi:hypothetical protein
MALNMIKWHLGKTPHKIFIKYSCNHDTTRKRARCDHDGKHRTAFYRILRTWSVHDRHCLWFLCVSDKTKIFPKLAFILVPFDFSQHWITAFPCIRPYIRQLHLYVCRSNRDVFFVLGSYAYIGRSPQKGIHLFMSVFLIFLLTLTLFKSTLLFVPLVLLLLVISYFSIAGIAFIQEKSRQRNLFGIAIFFACRQSDHLSLVLGNRIL